MSPDIELSADAWDMANGTLALPGEVIPGEVAPGDDILEVRIEVLIV